MTELKIDDIDRLNRIRDKVRAGTYIVHGIVAEDFTPALADAAYYLLDSVVEDVKRLSDDQYARLREGRQEKESQP